MINIKWFKTFTYVMTLVFITLLGVFIYPYAPIVSSMLFISVFLCALQLIIDFVFSIKLWRRK